MFQVTFTSCVVVNLLVILCFTISEQSKQIKTVPLNNSYFEIYNPDSPPKHYNITEQSLEAIMAIDRLLSDPAQLVHSSIKGQCNKVLQAYSTILNNALKSLLVSLIAENRKSLSEIYLGDIPNYYTSFSNKTSDVEFNLTNCAMKGVENIELVKYDLDFCKLYTDIEIKIPHLEILSSYSLKGNISGSSISGTGQFKVILDNVHFVDRSYLECHLALFTEDGCRYSNKNKTVDLNIQTISVYESGIKFKGLTESKFNEELNKYISKYMKSSKEEFLQQITDALEKYKKSLASHTSPIGILKKFKKDVTIVTNHMTGRMLDIAESNIYSTYLLAYI